MIPEGINKGINKRIRKIAQETRDFVGKANDIIFGPVQEVHISWRSRIEKGRVGGKFFVSFLDDFLEKAPDEVLEKWKQLDDEHRELAYKYWDNKISDRFKKEYRGEPGWEPGYNSPDIDKNRKNPVCKEGQYIRFNFVVEPAYKESKYKENKSFVIETSEAEEILAKMIGIAFERQQSKKNNN